MTTLQTGDAAPSFALTNQDGDLVQSTAFSGKRLFVFFYPKANTSG